MNTWRKIAFDCKSISWILIVSILLIALLPAHYDLRYSSSDAASPDEAVVDLHLLTITTGQSHHEDDATFFEASPEVIMKIADLDNPPFVIFGLILLVFVIPGIRIQLLRSSEKYIHPVLSHFYYTHQLRAPPHLTN